MVGFETRVLSVSMTLAQFEEIKRKSVQYGLTVEQIVRGFARFQIGCVSAQEIEIHITDAGRPQGG